MNDELFFTPGTAVGAVLGYGLHVMLSWGEWRKLSGNAALGFREFVLGDPPAQFAGIFAVLITYFSLPLLGSLEWVEQTIGFVPTPNVLSAALVAFASQGIAVKIRNIGRKLGE